MNRFLAVVTAPIAAAGGLVRITSSVIFARGRSWSLWIRRLSINYQSEVGDPMRNSIVGAVVGWIARNFPEAPVRIVREDDPEGKPIRRSATGPGAMLRLLEKPNGWFSGIVLWKATLVDYLRGDGYWLKVRSGSPDDPPALRRVVELWWLPRSMTKPHWPADDNTVFIDYYEYTVDGVRYAIDPKDVVHFRNGMDPATQGRTGVDELGDLWREIYTDEEAAQFTASLLRNLGVPGVVVSPANTNTGRGRVLQADPESVSQKFEEMYGGGNRGKPITFNMPTDVKVLSWNPQQMDLKALRRIPEERVTAKLGVPAGVVGMGAGLDRNTFNNLGEANVSAYTQGVIPRQREIAAELEVQLLPEFVADAVEEYDVFFDASVTAAMQALADAIWKRAGEHASKGLITRAAYKRMTGQKVAEDGSDDVYLRPNNVIEIPATVRAGGNGNTPRSRPSAPARLAPGRAAIALLGPGGSEVRCSKCDRLLAEQASAPYRLKCGRCHTVNEATLEPAAA